MNSFAKCGKKNHQDSNTNPHHQIPGPNTPGNPQTRPPFKTAKVVRAADSDIDALGWHFLGVLQADLNFPQIGAQEDTWSQMIDLGISAWPFNGTCR
jgi:hypothetical protein